MIPSAETTDPAATAGVLVHASGIDATCSVTYSCTAARLETGEIGCVGMATAVLACLKDRCPRAPQVPAETDPLGCEPSFSMCLSVDTTLL